MSARQAFIPRPQSTAPPSETNSHSTDAREKEGSQDMFGSGNGRARSVAAFLGQKRTTDNASHGVAPARGPNLAEANANASSNRRSFDGIVRPVMTPMSIIPYPATKQLGEGTKQPGVAQTPRKNIAPRAFEFPTPVSAPRGPKKAFATFAESREDDASQNTNVHGNDIAFMEHGDEADVHGGVETLVGGYMRMFGGSGIAGNAGVVPPSLEHDIASPAPGYALGGPGTNLAGEGCETGDMFARSERNYGSHCGMKRGVHREDVEDNGYGSAKRMKQVPQDPNEYSPISTPRIPPTPVVATSSVDVPNPSLIANSLFGNIQEFISLEEIAADWKRWKECTTEEWLKGGEQLAQEFVDIIDMVKNHMTEKVLAYRNMISSIEEKRTEVNRNMTIIQSKGNTVRENISKLGTKK